jgi:hypothetical protein
MPNFMLGSMFRNIQANEANKRMRSNAAMRASKADPKDIAAIRNVANNLDKKGFKSAAVELRTRATNIERGFR